MAVLASCSDDTGTLRKIAIWICVQQAGRKAGARNSLSSVFVNCRNQVVCPRVSLFVYIALLLCLCALYSA